MGSGGCVPALCLDAGLVRAKMHFCHAPAYRE